MWNVKRDTVEFYFQKPMLLILDPPTNRLLIKILSFFYDLLELLNSYIAELTVLFQKVCKVGISWDQTIP